MKLLLYAFLFFLGLSLNAQVDPQLFLGLNEVSTADRTSIPSSDLNAGMVVMDNTDKKVYFFDGTKWVAILDNASKTIVENELFFQDTNFCYISMQINTTDYRVVRYNKTDVNIEAVAFASGAQPTTLTACQALTYN